MKVQVNEIILEGADRSVSFTPGLNIVAGPIASGKTTVIRYVRFLLGNASPPTSVEAREKVTTVSGSVVLGSNSFSISRRAVSTRTAPVEIIGSTETWRLPAMSASDDNTFVNWMLEQLDLPRLDVPSAPTKPDSNTTPVTINDYLMYSYLAQNELGNSVFGHQDNIKNIKRKYVFELIYGKYDVETASIQERLREVHGQIRQLRSQHNLFGTFFKDTELASRTRIEDELKKVDEDLKRTESVAVDLASPTQNTEQTVSLQVEIHDNERQVAELRAEIDTEERSLGDLGELVNQFEAHSAKLTRSIVAGKHLTDLEFKVCPRCGTEVSIGRSSEELCYLCLQEPSLKFSREILIDEQGDVEQQLKEAQDLINVKQDRVIELRNRMEKKASELTSKRNELDFLTQSYISEHASQIAANAAQRERLISRSKQLNEYLEVWSRIDRVEALLSELAEEQRVLERDLESAQSESEESTRRINHLRLRFNEILERFRPPSFGEQEQSDISHSTYLPIYHGRSFAELSSPGLATLVNVAHALAHHLTSIELGLKLPQFLIIDGLSEHLDEALDPARLNAIYDVLIDTSEKFPDLQVIVVDHEVPESARPFVRLELSAEDRLIRTA